jgi:hypothetical protein
MESNTVRRWIIYGGFYIIFKPAVEVWIRCIICLEFTLEERRKIVNTGNLANLRVFQSTQTLDSDGGTAYPSALPALVCEIIHPGIRYNAKNAFPE